LSIKRWKLAAMLAALAVAACGKSGPPPISAGERFVAPEAEGAAYHLGAGDRVHLTVFNEPQLSGDFSVMPEGTLSLPLIGNVPALGKTTTELSATIETEFANGYLRNPRVSMEVITYRPYFILGEVKAPGQYPYVSGSTVVNAIAVAQGYTPRAQKDFVLIRGYGEDKEKKYRLTPDLRLRPGDTVRLLERYF
jgi:polysaccharide biosynthesis/export protein